MEKQEKEDNNSASSKHDEIEPKYSRVEKNKGKQNKIILIKVKLIILIKVNKLKHKETKESSEDVLETNKSQKLNKKEQKQVLMKLLTRN